MAIEFREIRKDQIDELLSFAATLGPAIDRAALRHNLSLVALDREGSPRGLALFHLGAEGRPRLRIDLAPDTPPGLARLLLDRALRKAESRGMTTTHIEMSNQAAADQTFRGADLLLRLQATVRPHPPVASITPPLDEPVTETDTDTQDDTAAAA